MKKLLLPVTLLAFCAMAHAGADYVPLRSGGVARRDRNMYRPIPRGQVMNPNASAAERSRQIQYQPTQHYYLRDNIVSYRYTTGSSARFAATKVYLGPKGAEFTPEQEQLSPHAGVRNYAAVTKRPQPGVPMIPRRGDAKLETASRKAAESRIQLADRR